MFDYFVKLKAINRKNSCVIRGAGVKVHSLKKKTKTNTIPTIALVARMLKDKGINEFVEAAKFLKSKNVKGRFILVGDVDPLNPSSLEKKDLINWHNEKNIEWLGWIENINEILENTDILCLPSYREGLPKALLEGAAKGLPIVTTDTVGCRDVVQNNLNGYLVPIKNSVKLADKLEILIKDPEIRERMGKEHW